MMFTIKYPLELRLEVVEAHRNQEGGYKRLAKRFGLDRDLVRYWVLDRKRKHPDEIEVPKPMPTEAVVKRRNKDPATEKELQDLRMQVAYYKKLSEILETEYTDVKKKHAEERCKQLLQQDTP